MDRKLDTLADRVKQTAQSPGQPPLEQWNPELSGDMDLRIRRDGQWLYKGEPMAREAIVRLFSTILRRESDGHFYLVSPVEKWRIQVEDAPLLAHSLSVEGVGPDQVIRLVTNVGESLEVSDQHPLEVSNYPDSDEPRPVVRVRHGVDARLVTAAYYDLAEHVVAHEQDGESVLGVFSNGKFYKFDQGG